MAAGIIGTILGGALTGGIGPAISATMPSIADTAKILVDRLVPDPGAKAAAQAEVEQALAAREVAIVNATMEVAKAQAGVNLAEAQNPSLFVGGWRPFAGWACGIGLVYATLFQPLLAWATGIAGAALAIGFPPPPVPPTEVLMTLLTGMLGIAGLRSYDKVKGTAANDVGSKG